jgi:hypothetical protein
MEKDYDIFYLKWMNFWEDAFYIIGITLGRITWDIMCIIVCIIFIPIALVIDPKETFKIIKRNIFDGFFKPDR